MEGRTKTPERKYNLTEIIKKLSTLSFDLHQDTQDKAQLNPIERLNSISKVWDACKDKLGKPATAFDVGSGFGYGTVFLESQNIKTIGIENISKKILQGQELFKKVGAQIPTIQKLDFAQHPAFYEGDINNLPEHAQADLVSVFYLSLEMVSKPETFKTFRDLIKKDGSVLLSTQASNEEVQAFFSNTEHAKDVRYEIIEVPNNFEKTAVLLKFD